MGKTNKPATLHLQVMDGLCSRFRAVVGASAYCDATGKKLIVYWPPRDHHDKIGTIPFAAKMSDLWNHPYEECNDDLPRFPKDRAALDNPGDVRLRECHLLPFVPYIEHPMLSHLARFKVTEPVRDMMRSVVAGLPGPTVGVIARWKGRNHPRDTPDTFADCMREIVDVCPNVQFYLATDSVEVDELIHKMFGSRVTGLKHGTDYKYDRIGIMRSLADLHIVAACDWVVGTRRSTYAQMAAFLRGGERAGPINANGSVKGGRYEATDNPVPEGEMLRALGCANQAS